MYELYSLRSIRDHVTRTYLKLGHHCLRQWLVGELVINGVDNGLSRNSVTIGLDDGRWESLVITGLANIFQSIWSLLV